MTFRTEGTGLLLEAQGGLSPQGSSAPCSECTAAVASLMPQKHGQEGEQPVSPSQGEPILFTFSLIRQDSVCFVSISFLEWDGISDLGSSWDKDGARDCMGLQPRV